MATKNNEEPIKAPDENTASKAKTTRPRKPAAVSETLNSDDTVGAVAKKARKTAKKVAVAVTETVREIAEKVGRKASSGTKKATTAAKKPARATRSTRASAMAPGTTDKDVADTILDLSSSAMPNEQTIADEAATDVKQHFFHDQHIHAGPPPPQAPRDLPDEYGDTKLVLLVRDPEWVYAYWELSQDTRRHFQLPDNGSEKNLVLRLFKISGRNWPDEPAHYFFDIEVGSGARSWYVQLPEANENWCAEIGLFDEQSIFVTVCRSNVINTPRNSISDHVDSEWMTVEESFEKITRLSSENLEMRLRGDSTLASESILRTIQRQLTGVLHGEKAAMSSALFSSESALPTPNKDFWLHVDTEVILYGATEPDAKVTVQGQPINLNSDGTFSIRFAFPNGEQELQVKAVKSSNDMEETITPIVSRTTR